MEKPRKVTTENEFRVQETKLKKYKITGTIIKIKIFSRTNNYFSLKQESKFQIFYTFKDERIQRTIITKIN